MTNTDSEAIEAYSYNAARQEEDEYVQNIKAFRLNAIIFCLIMPVMILINLTLSPSYLWVKWLALFWLASFVLHAFVIKLLFGVFDTKWEKRMAEEYRNRE